MRIYWDWYNSSLQEENHAFLAIESD